VNQFDPVHPEGLQRGLAKRRSFVRATFDDRGQQLPVSLVLQLTRASVAQGRLSLTNTTEVDEGVHDHLLAEANLVELAV
jgi:hypothetical protein